MINGPRKHRRTCWSIIFSESSPYELLLKYLCIFSLVQGASANAQDSITKTYYLKGNGKTREPSSICINAPPGCVLSARGFFSGNKLAGFDVERQCDESDEITYLGRESLGNQLGMRLFHGTGLCNETLTNRVLKDPIKSRYRHNTEYSVNLGQEDRVELTYRPLLSDPNC
jgi:hypothetical protein